MGFLAAMGGAGGAGATGAGAAGAGTAAGTASAGAGAAGAASGMTVAQALATGFKKQLADGSMFKGGGGSPGSTMTPLTFQPMQPPVRRF